MSVLDGVILNNKSYMATTLDKIQPYDPTTGTIGPVSWIPKKTFHCKYFANSADCMVMNVTLRTNVIAKLLARPEEVKVTDFTSQGRVRIYRPCEKQTPIIGAVNLTAGYAAGVSSMVVDGFTDKAALIKPGDMFTIDLLTKQYEVINTERNATTGNTTKIYFWPVLAAPVLDNAVLTLTPKTVYGEFMCVYPSDMGSEGQVIQVYLKATDA
jgi:hypothetical protein